MADFYNRNRFTLFKNDRKTQETHPDYTGTFTDENNVEFYMDAWIKEGKKGKFMSGRVKPKQQGGHHAEPQKSGGGWARDLDDTGPF